MPEESRRRLQLRSARRTRDTIHVRVRRPRQTFIAELENLESVEPRPELSPLADLKPFLFMAMILSAADGGRVCSRITFWCRQEPSESEGRDR